MEVGVGVVSERMGGEATAVDRGGEVGGVLDGYGLLLVYR